MARNVSPPDPNVGKQVPMSIRRMLSKWDIGETRKKGDYEVTTKTHSICRCIALGYLSCVKNDKPDAYKWETYKVTRTNLFLPPAKYPKQPEGSIFPWGLDEHWDRIERSPLHTQRIMFEDMIGLKWDSKNPPSREEWRAKGRKLCDLRETYTRIGSRSMLDTIRDILTCLVQNGDIEPHMWTPDTVKIMASPERFAQTMTTILLKPVIEDAKVVRFEPLSDEEQMDYMDVVRSRKTLGERIVEYYRRQTRPSRKEPAAAGSH